MRRSLGSSLLLFSAVAFAQPSPRGEGAVDEGNPRVEAELVADVEQVAPGQPFRVGVRFELDPGWHIYWRNPGDSGLSTRVQLQAEQAEFDPVQWPFPKTFVDEGDIVTYGYGEQVLLFTKATSSATAGGTLPVTAKVDLLACEKKCIPAKMNLSLLLPVGEQPQASGEAKLFERWAKEVPQPAQALGRTVRFLAPSATLAPNQTLEANLLLEGDPKAVWTPGAFVPEAQEGLAKLEVRPTAEAGVLHVRATGGPDGEPRPLELRGVYRPPEGGPFEVRALAQVAPGPLLPASAQAAAAVPVPPDAPSVPLALLFAFLGGLLLNLMPCVFPVLAVKVYGFVHTVHAGKGRVAAHALAYLGGVVGSLMVLAGVVVAAKAAGHAVGWGFQFQEPLFVAALCALLLLFALNLFGLFHVGVDANALAGQVDHAHGLKRSAGEGLLAVVLATPCSAPFLGSAVGFGLTAGPVLTFATFFMVGVGLALPFCLLVLVPGLAKRLPKPGMWMERGKHLLGFALLGTAVWLVWVMGGLSGVNGMGQLLAFLVAVALGGWLLGAGQSARSGRSKALAYVLAVGVVAVSAPVLLRFEPQARAATLAGMGKGHAAWSDEAVAAALASGRPVFVDFTADWCITCKFNERTVLSSDEVKAAFTKHRTEVLVGDWTQRDARIGGVLERHGRAGVPMYLVYSPHRPQQPEVLPELLTPAVVSGALERAAACSPGGVGC